jgi:hypothetical protein
MNSLAPIEFIWPHLMATKMDSITIVKWQPWPFWLPSNSIIIVQKKNWKGGNLTSPPYVCFSRPQGLVIEEKYGYHPIVTIFWMATKVFQSPKKGGHTTIFWKPLDDRKILVDNWGRLKIYSCHRDGQLKDWVAPLCDDQNILVAIGLWRCVGWWPKNFNHHLTHPHH